MITDNIFRCSFFAGVLKVRKCDDSRHWTIKTEQSGDPAQTAKSDQMPFWLLYEAGP